MIGDDVLSSRVNSSISDGSLVSTEKVLCTSLRYNVDVGGGWTAWSVGLMCCFFVFNWGP